MRVCVCVCSMHHAIGLLSEDPAGVGIVGIVGASLLPGVVSDGHSDHALQTLHLEQTIRAIGPWAIYSKQRESTFKQGTDRLRLEIT